MQKLYVQYCKKSVPSGTLWETPGISPQHIQQQSFRCGSTLGPTYWTLCSRAISFCGKLSSDSDHSRRDVGRRRGCKSWRGFGWRARDRAYRRRGPEPDCAAWQGHNSRRVVHGRTRRDRADRCRYSEHGRVSDEVHPSAPIRGTSTPTGVRRRLTFATH